MNSIDEALPGDIMSQRYKKYFRIEASLFIAGMLGAFILNGYAFLEKYNLVLDIPIDRLDVSVQKIASYGAAGLGSVLAAIIFAVVLVFAATLMIALGEKPGREPAQPASTKWVKLRQRARELTLPLKILAAAVIMTGFIILAWYLTVHVPSESGRKSALKTAAECEERTLYFRNTDRYEACQVGESADMFFLLKREAKDGSSVSFKTIQVPKEGFIRSEGKVSTLTFKS